MKKLFIETYGCQMNVADSEVVASVMQMAGYELCEKEEEADAILLNTCSIRENAENKIYNRLETLHAEQKKGRNIILGVLGCMAERVKDDLIENHRATTHRWKQGERLCKHHAWLQQLLPLLHRALYKRQGAKPRCGKHTERGERLARQRFQGGNPVRTEREQLWSYTRRKKNGGGSKLCRTAPQGGS